MTIVTQKQRTAQAAGFSDCKNKATAKIAVTLSREVFSDLRFRAEPYIQIGDHVLTEAQAMAVRVAVTNFHMETGDRDSAREIGAIAVAYHARLTEVLRIIFKETVQRS